MKAATIMLLLALTLVAVGGRSSVTTVPPFAIGGATTGLWYDPQQSGQGFDITIAQNNTFIAVWFVFTPNGSAQSWIFAQGTYDPTSTTITIPSSGVFIEGGTAFPPNFNHNQLTRTNWGTLTFNFTDCNTGTVAWNSTVSGYGSGTMNLSRLTATPGLSCAQ